MFPERFSNKTNGVTPRRWLLLANPALANLVTTAIGEAWITNLAELGRLKPLVNDTGFLDAFQKASLQAKGVFADVLRAKYGETVDPDTIFDSQVKRIHEYKKATSQCVANRRPLQSASRKPESRDGAANLSFRWQGGARLQTCQTDHQIDQQSRIAGTIDGDRAMRGRMKVLFLPDYNVSLAERLIPASDISNQV